MSALQTPRITPFLWFDQNAEEAASFYISVFKNSRKLDELHGPDGKLLTIAFELDGLQFTAINGGPNFRFNKAVSFVVHCDTQQEIDEYWTKLSEDGAEVQCGWLDDRFGLSWQIVPRNIAQLVSHPRAFEAMLKMVKLDIAALELAAQAQPAP